MSLQTSIFITTQFEAWHRWLEAPDECAYLRDYHRHIFHVEMNFPVTKSRQIEFIEQKQEVERFIRNTWEGTYQEYSCEDFAELLMVRFANAECAIVSEDGENGAVVTRSL